MEYKGIKVTITACLEESTKHLDKDFKVLMDMGIENIIKEKFIPWLLGADFQDVDKAEVFAGLKLYEIDYYYGKIVAEYSPTGKEDNFGQFEFCFESNNDVAREIFQAVAMQVYVLNGEVVKVSGYDI